MPEHKTRAAISRHCINNLQSEARPKVTANLTGGAVIKPKMSETMRLTAPDTTTERPNESLSLKQVNWAASSPTS
eukprot:16433585-Heterocapsa_arctica.AAC.1